MFAADAAVAYMFIFLCLTFTIGDGCFGVDHVHIAKFEIRPRPCITWVYVFVVIQEW